MVWMIVCAVNEHSVGWFGYLFVSTTNIPPNGLDICLCRQRAESPMASIAQGNALGKSRLGSYAL